MLFIALILGTLVSEDLTCISAGLLIRDGHLSYSTGAAACTLGIVIGDIGLWTVGRLSHWIVSRWPAMRRYAGRLPVEDMRRWLDEHAVLAMCASRFLPGTRLPLYITAGIVGMPLRRFTTWAAVAAAVWTPILVGVSSASGNVLPGEPGSNGTLGWITRLAVVVSVFALLKVAVRRISRERAFTSRLQRWSRWEFWPMWLFYAPVAAWIAWLSIRHRGLSTVTASNPGIPDGGLVGESKFQILTNLPAESIVPSALVSAATSTERVRGVERAMQQRGWRFPIILKPDVGQRGVGVRLARTGTDIETYCAGESGPILVQPYHPGPFEAGIFYYRFPGQPRGRIFSITDKHFPTISGDGRSSIEALIWAHPRYRLQASTFLRRHRQQLGRVLAGGEVFQLAIAGNHAQGTLFRDGSHLWSAALERRIDEIGRAYSGFFVGRFDVRYADAAALRAGEGFAIVELNGATAESTDIYDPSRTLVAAYRTLFTQWSIVFAIGAANRASGAQVTTTRRLIHILRAHATSTPAFGISD